MLAFRKRPGETPQETGRRFEEYWADIFGVRPVPGSGNQWHAKMDVGDGAILWSLKHTGHQSFRLAKGLMREVAKAINGLGGRGGTIIPGIAVDVDGEPYVVLRAEDFVHLMTQDARYIPCSTSDAKRQRSRVPSLLRDELPPAA